MQNNNTTNNSINTGNSTNSGNDTSGLSRQLINLQTEILSKIEVLLEKQNRLEIALQAVALANGSLTGTSSNSSNNISSASI